MNSSSIVQSPRSPIGSMFRGIAVGVMASSMAAGCGDAAPESTESSTAASTVCAGPNVVHGMDVSHYDGSINWATAKANGIDFAFVKATESTTYVDPTFATNWAGMKAAGVVRGAYHFFRANTDPTVQAQHVATTVGMLEAGDLPIVLDLETADGQSGATIGANAVTFLDAVTAATGKTAIVYTSPGFITGTIGSPPARLGHYTLWVANWGVSCPNVPAPWSTWVFWQSSSTGTVPGVPASAVDLDTFNGTLAQLQAFGGSPSPDAGGPPQDAGQPADAGGGTHDGGGNPGDASTGGDGGSTQGDSGGGGQADGGGGGGGDGGGGGGGGGGGADSGGGDNAAFSGSAQASGCAVGRGGDAPRSGALLALLGVITVGARRRRRA